MTCKISFFIISVIFLTACANLFTPAPSPTATEARPSAAVADWSAETGIDVTVQPDGGWYAQDNDGQVFGKIVLSSKPDEYLLQIETPAGSPLEVPLSQVIQSKAILIDNGERVGYVWKGDSWAEILLDIEFQTDGTELDNLPTVTMEDVTSGRLAEAERLAAEPFPEGVKPLDNYTYDKYSNKVYPKFDVSTETGWQKAFHFSEHPEDFPMKFAFYYQVESNDLPLVMASLQVLNQDYTSMFIHEFVDRDIFDVALDDYNMVIQLRLMPTFNMATGGGDNDVCKKGSSDEAAEKVLCPLNAPQKERLDALMQKLVEEQSFPEEFERIPFLFSVTGWY